MYHRYDVVFFHGTDVGQQTSIGVFLILYTCRRCVSPSLAKWAVMRVGGNVALSYSVYRGIPHYTTVELWLKRKDVVTCRIIYIIRGRYSKMLARLICLTRYFSYAAYCLRSWVLAAYFSIYQISISWGNCAPIVLIRRISRGGIPTRGVGIRGIFWLARCPPEEKIPRSL